MQKTQMKSGLEPAMLLGQGGEETYVFISPSPAVLPTTSKLLKPTPEDQRDQGARTTSSN